MLHFPSTFQNNGLPKRIDSLNATQQKQHSPSNQIFLKIEEELHDARRVHMHGQEDDLRMALNMVISRVSEMSTLLSDAYKAQAELEVQLNVAKSNLQLVISNNEMLEEALKSGNAKDVGWRRWSAREGENKGSLPSDTRPASVDIPPALDNTASPTAPSSPPSTTPTTSAPPQDSRFFKFRFNSSSSSTTSRAPSRPQTPTNPQTSPKLASNAPHHLNSASMPSLLEHTKELEELAAQLDKEKAARKTIMQEKAALEAELESLSQALFEEANKMVATERIKRAETEEELKEARQQKEALRSALRIIEGEVEVLRGSRSMTGSPTGIPQSITCTRSRSSSQVGMKSPPASPTPPHTRTNSVSSAPSDTHEHYGVATSSSSRVGSQRKSVDRPEALPLPDSPDLSLDSEKTPMPIRSSSTSSVVQSPASSAVAAPSPGPAPSSTPQSSLVPAASNEWLDAESASPWADVSSSSSRPSSLGNSIADTTLFSETQHRI